MTLLEAGQGAGAILTIVTLLGLFIKWAIVKPIKSYIDHATYPIQPEANGGRSLADVARTVMRIEGKQTEIDQRLEVIEDLVTKPATRSRKTTSD